MGVHWHTPPSHTPQCQPGHVEGSLGGYPRFWDIRTQKLRGNSLHSPQSQPWPCPELPGRPQPETGMEPAKEELSLGGLSGPKGFLALGLCGNNSFLGPCPTILRTFLLTIKRQYETQSQGWGGDERQPRRGLASSLLCIQPVFKEGHTW